MPSLPQFLDGTSPIRRIEIDRKDDIEHSAEPHRHIGIAAEIKIDFKSISQNHENGRRRVQTEGLCKTIVHNESEDVGEQNLFAETENEQDNTLRKILYVQPAVRRILELGNHFLI